MDEKTAASEGCIISITIEVKPNDPSQMDNLVSKILKYEIPFAEKAPIKFRLLKGEREIIQDVDMPD